MASKDPEADYFEEYKSFGINGYKQPYRGGGREYYFGVWSNNQKMFGCFFRMSDTQVAVKKYNTETAYKRVFNFGLNKVKKLIDSESYQAGSDVRYWVNE